jgi:hypothetical protein
MKRLSGPRKTASNLSESVNQQLNMYVLAASAAGVTLLAFSQLSEASIVYTKANVVLGARGHSFYNLDLNHDGIVDLSLLYVYATGTYAGVKTFHSNVFVPYNTQVNPLNRVVGRGAFPVAMRAGVKVRRLDNFISEGFVAAAAGAPLGHPLTYYGAWANGGKGLRNRYLGLRFVIKGKIHFGWARVSVSKWPFAATLTGYAYETIAGKAIIAGATQGPDDAEPAASLNTPTPVPATLGALAMGAPGLSIWRRKETQETIPQ